MFDVGGRDFKCSDRWGGCEGQGGVGEGIGLLGYMV